MSALLCKAGGWLLIIGISIFISGFLNLDFSQDNYKEKLKEYFLSRENKNEPTLDQKRAYNSYIFYRAGGYSFVVGAICFIASLLMDG